jgi:hypothetical protein
VTARTAYRWAGQEAFKAELARQADILVEDASRQAAASMGAALAVLASIMGDTLASPSARVSAARSILETGLRFAELVTLAERVARLEERINGGAL